jgi:hypothetical protein
MSFSQIALKFLKGARHFFTGASRSAGSFRNARSAIVKGLQTPRAPPIGEDLIHRGVVNVRIAIL